jgi:hypothetical protein
MDMMPNVILEGIAVDAERMAKSTLMEIFESAIDRQSEEGFPQEFRDHVMDVVSNNQEMLTAIIDPNSVEVYMDWNTLGTKEDLERAFHQGAKLANGDIVDGPYNGEELENPVGQRHDFWLAIREGATSVQNPKGAGRIPIKPGAWEETKRKYIEIWGDQAPEWLYLQFGQTLWEPHIRPSSIIEDFNAIYGRRFSQLWNDRLKQYVEDAQHGRIRLTSNISELGPSGKPRRAGQFYPRR